MFKIWAHILYEANVYSQSEEDLPRPAEESFLAFVAAIHKWFGADDFIEVNIISNNLNPFQFFIIADVCKRISKLWVSMALWRICSVLWLISIALGKKCNQLNILLEMKKFITSIYQQNKEQNSSGGQWLLTLSRILTNENRFSRYLFWQKLITL